MMNYRAESSLPERDTEAPAETRGEPARAGMGAFWFLTLGAAYLAVAVAVTYPLIRQLGVSLPGRYSDQPFYVWAIDTFWTQVRAGTTPFWTDRVLYPIGANLMHATIAPFVSLFAYPFESPITYLSVAVLVSLVAAALGIARLVHALTANAAAGAVAGLCYGFSPAVLSIVKASHYYTAVAAALMAWGMVALLAFLSTGRVRALVGLSVTTWALVFTDYYVTMMFLVFVAIVGIRGLAARPERIRRVVVAAVANAAVALLIVRALPPLDTTDLPAGGLSFTSQSNTNLADFLVPSVDNPLLGPRFAGWAFDHYNSDVDSYFLGWGLLTLAIVGAATDRRGVVSAVSVAAIVSLVLACGTAIRWGRHELLVESHTPWHWFAELPSLHQLDAPRRFAIGVQLGVATLIGVALATMAQRGGRRFLIATVGVLLFVAEYGQIGMPWITLDVPRVVEVLRSRPGDRTLLELPSGITESKGGFGLDLKGGVQNGPQMYWQTIHRKRRVGGYLSRIPLTTYHWFEKEPVIGDLFTLTSTDGSWGPRHLDALPDYPPDVVQHFIDVFDLGWIVLGPNPRQDVFAEGVERLLSGRIRRREDVDGYVLYTLAD